MTSPHVRPRFSGVYEFQSKNKSFLNDQYRAANQAKALPSSREMFELLMQTQDDAFRRQGHEPAAPKNPQDAYIVTKYHGRIIGLTSHDALALKNTPKAGIVSNSGQGPDSDTILDAFFKKRKITPDQFRPINLDNLFPSEIIDTYGLDSKGSPA